jgi:hypothetical protein
MLVLLKIKKKSFILFYSENIDLYGKLIVQWVQRRDTGWIGGALFPAGASNISLLHNVQNAFGAHPASYPLVQGALT